MSEIECRSLIWSSTHQVLTCMTLAEASCSPCLTCPNRWSIISIRCGGSWLPRGDRDVVLLPLSGKSHPWTNASLGGDFWQTCRGIGPCHCGQNYHKKLFTNTVFRSNSVCNDHKSTLRLARERPQRYYKSNCFNKDVVILSARMVQIFPENKAPRDWSLRMSLEIHVD